MDVADRQPRILITRLSALGDCILTLPMACAIRRHYPQAFLAWATEPLSAKVLTHHTAIDELVVVPKRWLQSWRTIRALRARLRGLQVDCVLDPQGLTKSAGLGWLSGAGRRIGFARPQAREIAPWLATELVPWAGQHLVDATLRLLSPLGIVEPAVEFRFPSEREAEVMVERFLQDAHLGGGFAAINPGATWASKRWQPRRFGQVARYLGEQLDLPTVITWFGDEEAAWTREIVNHSGGHAIAAPPTTVMQLAALFRRARFLLAPDTGPLHLAAAVGTPCIGLFGPTRPELSGPYGPQHLVLRVASRRHRNKHRRRADDSALRAISTEAVCGACSDLLDRLRNGRQATAASGSHAA